jgi:multidrug resistance efflux pump
MSALSGATTFAIGQVFKRHFGGGGDLFDVNLEKAKKIFEQELEKGKKVAQELEKMRHAKPGEKADKEEAAAPEASEKTKKAKEVFDQLERLAELRDKGIVTQEEFQVQKDKLLASL